MARRGFAAFFFNQLDGLAAPGRTPPMQICGGKRLHEILENLREIRRARGESLALLEIVRPVYEPVSGDR